jgi:hypothetical protein
VWIPCRPKLDNVGLVGATKMVRKVHSTLDAESTSFSFIASRRRAECMADVTPGDTHLPPLRKAPRSATSATQTACSSGRRLDRSRGGLRGYRLPALKG